MDRQPLLLETLVTRQVSRMGQAYLYRRPMGPKPADKEAINRFLHKVSQEFDFGPLMTGDQQQARQMALDYIRYLKQAAKKAKIPEKEMLKRLKQISPHLMRGLRTFYLYLDAKVKTA